MKTPSPWHPDQMTIDECIDNATGGPIFAAPIIEPAETGTIQQKFEQFHQLNPWVADALVRLIRELRANGHDKIGIGMVFEVLRWHYMRMTIDPASDFKLNNNYRSRYARLIADQHPDLADAFEMRTLKSAYRSTP